MYYKERGCFGLCAKFGVVANDPTFKNYSSGKQCEGLQVPYNMLLTAKEDLRLMKKMLACGIPFAYVRWTDGAGHVLEGKVKMDTALRGRMDSVMRARVKKLAPNGWLQGEPLQNLVRDTWSALNISHPRFMLGMPIPACSLL